MMTQKYMLQFSVTKWVFPGLISVFLFSCTAKVAKKEDTKAKAEVAVISPQKQIITEYLKLNAVTQFQKKISIMASNTGYINQLNFKQGDGIVAGGVFCLIKTKEQQALKNIVHGDSSLTQFQKALSVIASATGTISVINVQQGDYVSEGDILATLVVPNSLILAVNVPYEYRTYVSAGTNCNIQLPDGRKWQQTITQSMPLVDAVTQAQQFIIRLPNAALPENLNVFVLIPYKKSGLTLCVPSSAIQTDEMQQFFWVMKVVNQSIAIKFPVTIGLQNDSLTEIKSDGITEKDLIIITGAYGLADSSAVIIKR
jgi:hypothetical protein